MRTHRNITRRDSIKSGSALADWARNDMGDYDRVGKNARFFDPGPHRPGVAKWSTKRDQQ